MASSRSSRQGLTLVEVLAAVAVVGISLIVTMQQIAISHKDMRQQTQRLFAYQKAIAILSELQAAVGSGAVETAADLDALTDAQPNPVLTTRTAAGQAFAPDHPMSGNLKLQTGAWEYWRQVEVHPIAAGSERMRYVRVSVLRSNAKGKSVVEASMGGVLNLLVEAAPSVKEYDVYVVAIGAAPSLWMPLSSLRASLSATVAKIGQDNPGLHFRLHWITKFGYGRDPSYVPFINESATAEATVPWAYWYPGRLGERAPFSELYSPAAFSGRVRTEAGVLNDYDAETNRHPHAVSDRFNHCMRTPAARRLFAQRVAAGLDRADEPPLQLLLADMLEQPERYRNALVLNLHGEALPVPPMRNYSDAAKVPERLPGVRVVTHASRLHVPRRGMTAGLPGFPGLPGLPPIPELPMLPGSPGFLGPDVEFRVHAYSTDADESADVLDEPITVQVFGGDFTDSAVIERQEGGVNPSDGRAGSGSTTSRLYRIGVAPRGSATLAPFEMHYETGFSMEPEPHTWFRLHNTPLTCPVVQGAGLDEDARLYGLEHVPSPVSGLGTFHELEEVSIAAEPKNTARWFIRLPQVALETAFGNVDVMVTAQTRIGSDGTSGQMWPTAHEPHNLSETYCWWTTSAASVPITERFQLLGDPRFSPYLDTTRGGVSFPHGYNWFFDDLRDDEDIAWADWTCFDPLRLRDGFAESVGVDVPRAMQIWRRALQASGAVLSHAHGRVAGSVVLGGEIALPGTAAGGGCQPVAVSGNLFGVPGILMVDTISAGLEESGAASRHGRRVLVDSDDDERWSIPWLGELTPHDDLLSSLVAQGNVPLSSDIHWERRCEAGLEGLPEGTSFEDRPGGGALADLGSASLLQIGWPMARFAPIITEPGTELTLSGSALAMLQAASRPHFPSDSSSVVWRTQSELSQVLPQVLSPLIYPDQAGGEIETLASDALGRSGAGILRVTSETGGGTAYVVVTGDEPSAPAAHQRLLEKALVFGLRGFHVGGEVVESQQGWIAPIPRVEILGPEAGHRLKSPAAMQLTWRASYARFDGEPLATSATEQDLVYVLTYAEDGQAFRYLENGELAQLGAKPTLSMLLLNDATPGDETFLVGLPEGKFPDGDYRFRVDCFDRQRATHGSHHEVHVRIERGAQ
ncbi:MAG: hypothetical protein AAF628_28800 [Planctomycetota bacterium]